MKASLVLLAASALALGAAATGRSPAPVNDAAVLEGMPGALSEFGFFADMQGQSATYGVEAYELKTALYSDGAEKLRFIYVPGGQKLRADGDGLIGFPVGSAIIKSFAFGAGADRRLIETRVLLHRADGWVALPYRWNDDQTEATLALAGARLSITTPAGEQISYRIPNKNQCKTCHSKNGEVIPIGPKVRNLSAEWLGDMTAAGYFAALPVAQRPIPDWTGMPGETAGATAALARGYLDVNCAHCHQPGGGASNSGLDLRWEQDDPHAIGIDKPPVAAGRGDLVSILPGKPDASIMVYRMDSAEPGIAMPELGKATVDPHGVAVVRRWIEQMPKEPKAP